MSLLQELFESRKPPKYAQKEITREKKANKVTPSTKAPVKKKAKKKVSESSGLSMTLMAAMLESTKLGDQPGMEHLKNTVSSEEAHRHYMHLAAADRMSPEERDEFDILTHSRTKAAPDPIKALEWKIHQTEAQLAHHQAHLNRANAKLQDSSTKPQVKEMIQYLTIPEQQKEIEKLTSRIEKYRGELNQLQPSEQF